MSDMKLYELDFEVTFRKHLYVWGADEDDVEEKVMDALNDDKIEFEHNDVGFIPPQFNHYGEINPDIVCHRLIFNPDDEPLD